MIGHIVFAISTISIFITVFAIYQRRGLLYNLGTDNPGWSACSFPFVNSAIAAGIYREVSFFYLNFTCTPPNVGSYWGIKLI